jgi:hypothetical protein
MNERFILVAGPLLVVGLTMSGAQVRPGRN